LKIDPTIPEGNLSQYICHSCDPNLGIKNRTCFVAFKNIKKDEEVTIDYGMIGYEYTDEISETGRECNCGSSICRGKWGCYKELTIELREKYKGYISDYLVE
jgi:SET domain-containing protein